MMKTGTTLACLATAASLLTLQPAPARAQQPAPKFDEQVSEQQRIYQSVGEKTVEGYVIDRSLQSYASTLHEEFDRSLAELGPNDRWLDIGAGQGQAVLDYYTPQYDFTHPAGREKRGTKASSIAMSIEDRRTPLWLKTESELEAGKIRYLHGKRLDEYAPGELGRFQIITDVIGGFSYSLDLDLFMEKTLAMLAPNGVFYTLLQDVHSEAGTNQPYYPNAPYLTEIVNDDGSKTKVCAWLKNIACVAVTCELRMGWQPPIEVYRIQKTCDSVEVPSLTEVHYQAGTPPERRYRLKAPAARPTASR